MPGTPRPPRPPAFDYDRAKQLLAETFELAEADFAAPRIPPIGADLSVALSALFVSRTQAYREVAVGCALVRLVDQTRNLQLPYVNQGDDAYNGRTLDERVVNPFLQEQTIPCSKGPFLSAFRRNIRFVPETGEGLRDKEGYAAFLVVVDALRAGDEALACAVLRSLLYRFLELRNAANIALAQVRRLSLEQLGLLIDGLLATPSGGLLPVLLALAMFNTLRDCFERDWTIDFQGINVADSASGVGGDITVSREGAVVLAVEVTERPIDRSRVVSTFNTKISPHGIEDYLFFSTAAMPDEEALAATRQYFAQGHEINFLQVKPWLMNCLGTIGPKCRALFVQHLLKALSGPDVPASAKLAWNAQVKALLG